MENHLPSISCWCQPIILQHCPVCALINNKDCVRCKGKHLIMAENTDNMRKLVVIHDHTIGKLPSSNCGLHMFFANSSDVSWLRVCEFIKDFYKDN